MAKRRTYTVLSDMFIRSLEMKGADGLGTGGLRGYFRTLALTDPIACLRLWDAIDEQMPGPPPPAPKRVFRSKEELKAYFHGQGMYLLDYWIDNQLTDADLSKISE